MSIVQLSLLAHRDLTLEKTLGKLTQVSGHWWSNISVCCLSLCLSPQFSNVRLSLMWHFSTSSVHLDPSVLHTLWNLPTLMLQKSLSLVQCQHPTKKVASSSCFPHEEHDIAADSSCLFLHIYLALLCFSPVMIICVTYRLCVLNKLFLKCLYSVFLARDISGILLASLSRRLHI